MSTEIPQKTSLSLRLLFLDGLRGLAALYVVLYHTYKQIDVNGPLQQPLSHATRIATAWLRNGHLAVDVFIVLSGYCLMLPVVHTPDGHLKGGVGGYLKRRARRIVPPYYAALALSFIPLLASQVMPSMTGAASAGWRFNFTPLAIGSHLLLIHNLLPKTATLYDPPMWSVATEWQIYFLFPILLVLWRRLGIATAVLAALVVGMLPHFLLPRYNFDWACPWYLGLFSLGMLGALTSTSENGQKVLNGSAWPWGILALAFFVPGFAVGQNEHSPYLWAADMAIGAATCCFLILCARHAYAGNTKSLALRILEHRWTVRLGVFSYSLYLIHSLFIIYYARLVQRFHIGHLSTPPAFFLVCTIGSLVSAYLFFLVVERRFLPGHLRSETRDALAVAVAPAP